MSIITLLEKYDYRKIYKFFAYAFVFTLPFQINIILYAPNVFSTGGFNIYSHFLLYLSDIFLLCSLFFVGLDIFLRKFHYFKNIAHQIFPLITLFLIFCVFSFVFSLDKNLTFFVLLRFFGFYFFYLLCVSGAIDFNEVKKVFVISMIFQAILAILQFIFQNSLGLSFLGEQLISKDIPGIAKIDIYDMKFIRAYGTFPHPNILAAFLLSAIFFVLQSLEKNKLNFVVITLLFLSLILTFSRIAFIGVIIMFIFFFRSSFYMKKNIKKIFLTVLIACLLFSSVLPIKNLIYERISDYESIKERVELIKISSKMFVENPLGVGFSNFTLKMNEFTSNKLFPWDYQPVHNVFLLILNEIGIVGAVIFMFIWMIILLNSKKEELGFFIALILFMLFDHFFFSIYAGQALIFIVLVLPLHEDFTEKVFSEIKIRI